MTAEQLIIAQKFRYTEVHGLNITNHRMAATATDAYKNVFLRDSVIMHTYRILARSRPADSRSENSRCICAVF